MNISKKLFLAFVGLTSIVLLATLSLARWSFDQGFLNYINTLEQERLGRLSTAVADLYQQSAFNWQNITVAQYRQLLRLHAPGPAPRPFVRGDTSANRQGMPPPDRRPPHLSEHKKPAGSAVEHRQPPHKRPDSKRWDRSAISKARFGPPTGIYDNDGSLLAGDAIEDRNKATYVPVTYKGELIAKLYSSPIVKVNSESAAIFSQQQLWTTLWIGLGCLLLASIISWLLARFLLVPVKEVVKGISYLSKGNYNERFSQQRQDELGQLMNDIDHLAMILDKTRTAKNRWFADISHELRTPLSILCGEIDAIKAGIRQFDQQQLESLEQEVIRIKHLVDDLYQLSLSDVGGLKYNIQPMDLTECISDTIASLGNKISAKGLAYRFNHIEPVLINADKMRMQQLVSNVILNSVAYTDSPGNIDIDLIQQNTKVLLLINDTKPSVATAECELLFEALHRQDSSRVRRSNGAGLGLTICRNIVEAHKGTITARPSNLGGLCIEIVLPLA
ncbi:HAMP domain-containing histidine kinase [Shewanella sp. UCD-KL21]|uniref:HAMP domain-containing histidine kinase n=1 Tax=Shewanella sp. UCD-KL21 TaxID=1917164 RepID=UPI000970DD82|nr:HAMP domain-containing histidine kinase [Shewanella sp. UCD-KL21]